MRSVAFAVVYVYRQAKAATKQETGGWHPVMAVLCIDKLRSTLADGGRHLRASFQAGLGPLPVQIGPCCIGAQVPSPAAVWIHVGHNIEDSLLKSMPRKCAVTVQKPL